MIGVSQRLSFDFCCKDSEFPENSWVNSIFSGVIFGEKQRKNSFYHLFQQILPPLPHFLQNSATFKYPKWRLSQLFFVTLQQY